KQRDEQSHSSHNVLLSSGGGPEARAVSFLARSARRRAAPTQPLPLLLLNNGQVACHVHRVIIRLLLFVLGRELTRSCAIGAAAWMAWKAVTEETQEMREIRDKVIFVLVPNLNPDGTTLVADWYMKHVGTPWEMSIPALYQKYAGHDNNRDWFMFTQPESRNI